MSTYAIGDIQGCFHALQELLGKIQFDATQDQLWLTGDLVNRGSQSLETLRFLKKLENNIHIVLGNHDLHLLAVAHGAAMKPGDTLTEILQAPDRDELIHWLSQQSLLHHDESLGFTMVHAGLAPEWDLFTAKKLAREVEMILQSAKASDYFKNMYGNEPAQWTPELTGWSRIRCITNYFTRLRFCYPDGRMNLKNKGPVESSDLIPWFQVPNRKSVNNKIIFGHWAALNGETYTPNTFALDTGCVWGNCLTAMRLEDEKKFTVSCQKNI